MAEEVEKPNAFAIDLKGLSKLENSGFKECPVCGCNAWFVLQAPGMVSTALPHAIDSKTIPQGYPLVSLACQRCGFLKMHVKLLLDHFLAEPVHGREDQESG